MLHISTGLTIYILILTFLLGAAAGSFLDCLAQRHVRGESVLRGRSHCDSCGHVLGAADLVPVFSYLFLRGRCRYCGTRVAPESLRTELLSGGLFVLLVLRFDVSLQTLQYLLLSCVLLGLSLVDLKTYTIPDGFIAAGILLWLVTEPLLVSSRAEWLGKTLSGLGAGVLTGGGMLLISLVFDRLTGKESLGGGDIKLFFMLGLYMSPLTALLHVILSCFTGLLSALLLRQERIPFGPSISAAAYLCFLVGRQIVEWYTGLI